MVDVDFPDKPATVEALTAGRLLTKRHVDFRFFESEGARAWLAERRKDLRALVP